MAAIAAHRRTTARALRATLAGAALLLWATTGIAIADSYLARCPGAGIGPDQLTVTATAPTESGCVTRRLPIAADAVLATLPAPRRAADAPEPQTVTITGAAATGSFDAREVTMTPMALGIAAPYLVPGADLRAVSSVAPLGALGRATLSTNGDDTILDCGAGTEPAGLALSTARLPPIPGMAIRFVHSADQSFRVVVARPDAPRTSVPRLLAKLHQAESNTESYVPLPADLPADTPLDIDVLCPAAGGHLALDEAVLEAQTKVPTGRGAWVRDVRRWQVDAADVFTRTQRWSMTRLYIGVPFGPRGLADPQSLAGFVADASSRGVDVWALLTDTASSLDSGRTLAVAGAALADYNAGVSTEAQLKGVMVEYAPDRLWRYAEDPAAEAQAFLKRLQPLKPVLGMPLAAAVPTWFPTDPSIAERWADALDAMTVITDKTDPTDVRRSVARFLAWGTRRSRPVEVALEAVPLEDSERGRFARAESGALWLITLGGSDVLVLLKQSASGLPGRAFQQEEVVPVPAASRSFAGQGAQLREVLTPLGHELGAWPSFAGFAFHGLFGGQH